MSAGARTFSLDDTFIEPQVLEPPPTRHALFLILLVLAGLLLLGTAGWGDLRDGIEGQFAGGAREMLANQQWLTSTINGIPQLQTPPLLYWLIILSYKVFGVTVAAARLPVALASVLSVALTFLIGERLAGYWRGFAAGLIYLCSCDTFIYGRMLTPEPVFSMFFTAAIFCLVCGYQRRRFRRAWFAALGLCLGLACLTEGIVGLFYFAGIGVLLAVFLREARMRLPYLLHWSCLLIFILVVGPWYGWIFHWPWPAGFSRWQLVILNLLLWFPASILIGPGLLFASRKVLRSTDFSFANVLPLCWITVLLVPLIVSGAHSYQGLLGTSTAFALWAATLWD
ncbi:MAG: glycosyltransferase family 39 protein, partial [Verrucomicrobiota bacterium]